MLSVIYITKESASRHLIEILCSLMSPPLCSLRVYQALFTTKWMKVKQVYEPPEYSSHIYTESMRQKHNG